MVAVGTGRWIRFPNFWGRANTLASGCCLHLKERAVRDFSRQICALISVARSCPENLPKTPVHFLQTKR